MCADTTFEFERQIPLLFRPGMSHEEYVLAAKTFAFTAYNEGVGEGYSRIKERDSKGEDMEAEYVSWGKRVEAGVLPDQGPIDRVETDSGGAVRAPNCDDDGSASNPRWPGLAGSCWR